jgi:hypothetical protein
MSASLILYVALVGAAQAAEQPSQDLLEFLGSFETADGEWLDPLALETLDNAALNGTAPDQATRDDGSEEKVKDDEQTDTKPDPDGSPAGRRSVDRR